MTDHELQEWFDLPEWLKDIICDDHVSKFVPGMMEKFPCPQNGYGLLTAVEKDAQEPTYCPKNIVYYIFTYSAVNCATALLEGETGVTLNPNHPYSQGRYPLHDATSAMSYYLVDLLLRHGAQADVRTTEVKPYTRGGLLPLSVAVENFRLHRYLLAWTPKQSIFKLIIIFCLPQMKAPLEICKLLASHTKDVVEVFNGYCMDGKFFEVVALLMVAREKLIDNVSGRLLIHKRITGEIEQLINEETKLCRTSKSVRACKNRITNLRNTLVALEVFERAGDAIGTYVHRVNSQASKKGVVNEVRRLLVERGFLLTHKDTNMSDIDCEDGSIKMATEILERKFRPPQQGIFLFGGSPWGSNAGKVMYNRKKNWAMGRFFVKFPILRHGSEMSRRDILLYARNHCPERMLPLLPYVKRAYFSIAWAGLRHL